MGSLSIAFASPGWPLEAYTSGIVTYVANVSPTLRAAGHRISVLAGETAPGAEAPDVYDWGRAVRARSWPRRLRDSAWYRLAPFAATRGIALRAITETARRLVRDRQVQVIDMEESFGWARAVQRAARVPVCVRLHGPYFLTGPAGGAPDDEAMRVRIRAEGEAIAAAAAVSAPSADVLDKVRRHYGIELPDAEVIPNPVPAVAEGDRWSLAGCDPKRVVFVGRFDRLKGADLVVEAFAQVLRRIPDARLTLVGPDGDCADDAGRTWRLEPFVRDRLPGALESGRVEWLGRQPATALAAFRRRALVTVVCSRFENFPYTVTEAMALGCPLVAARVAGIPEIVEDGVNGSLHRVGDAGDLAVQLVRLLEAPAQAAALGARAAADAARLLDADVVTRRLLALYEGAVRRGVA